MALHMSVFIVTKLLEGTWSHALTDKTTQCGDEMGSPYINLVKSTSQL